MRFLLNKKTSFVLASVSALIGTALYAGSINKVTATLANPVSTQTQIIAGDAAWNCEGTTCTANLERAKPLARDCRALAYETGKVVSFKVNETALDEKGLAFCNSGLK